MCLFSERASWRGGKGNVRLSYADSDLNGSVGTSEIIEESNYYAFGLKHKGYNYNIQGGNSLAQNWKYNGIELNEDLSLNLYEMEVRNYDPAIGRFLGIDPVTHYSQGTSVAFDNNPIFWADPSGANAGIVGTGGFSCHDCGGGTVRGSDIAEGGLKGVDGFVGGNGLTATENDTRRGIVNDFVQGMSTGGLSYEDWFKNQNNSISNTTNYSENTSSQFSQDGVRTESSNLNNFSQGSNTPPNYKTYFSNALIDIENTNFSIMETEDGSTLSWRIPVGAGLVFLGQPVLEKKFVTRGASRGTSYASHYLSKILPYKSPIRLPTINGGTAGSTLRFTGTKVIGRFLGRWVPFVGWALLVYDAYNFTVGSIEDLKFMGKYRYLHYLKHKEKSDWALRYGEREEP